MALIGHMGNPGLYPRKKLMMALGSKCSVRFAAVMVVLASFTACGPRTDVPLLMKWASDDAELYFPKDQIPKLSPRVQKALAEERPAGVLTYTVFWKMGFRAPKNEGERILICSDSTEIGPRPVDLNVEVDGMDGKPTGEAYTGVHFWVPPGKKPVALRIAGTRYAIRWATMKEAMRTGSWSDPATLK
jgi:hypothetical protein